MRTIGGADVIGDNPQDGRDMLHQMLGKLSQKDGSYMAWDDVSNVPLNPDLVKKARQVEMDFFKKMHVYDRVPRESQKKTGGKVIEVRWVDVNKGDEEKTDYRSRLVGQEFATHRDDSLYASTPPLEALRLVMSYAATIENDGNQRQI